MHSIIEVRRPQKDELTEEVWWFTVIDTKIILDAYVRNSRPTRRHKFTSTMAYSRLGRCELAETAVPWPEDVRQEALDQYIAELKVGRWDAEFGGHV